MSDCLKLVGKVPVVKERLTMVVMIGRMVDGTCLKRKVGIEVALLIWRGMKDFGNFINAAAGKDEKTM